MGVKAMDIVMVCSCLPPQTEARMEEHLLPQTEAPPLMFAALLRPEGGWGQ